MTDGSKVGRLAPWFALAVILIVGGLAVLSLVRPKLFVPTPDDSMARRRLHPPEVGYSCDALAAALTAHRRDRMSELASAIRVANRQALDALHKGSIRFGRQDAIAMKLASMDWRGSLSDRSMTAVGRRLQVAGTICRKVAS